MSLPSTSNYQISGQETTHLFVEDLATRHYYSYIANYKKYYTNTFKQQIHTYNDIIYKYICCGHTTLKM